MKMHRKYHIRLISTKGLCVYNYAKKTFLVVSVRGSSCLATKLYFDICLDPPDPRTSPYGTSRYFTLVQGLTPTAHRHFDANYCNAITHTYVYSLFVKYVKSICS